MVHPLCFGCLGQWAEIRWKIQTCICTTLYSSIRPSLEGENYRMLLIKVAACFSGERKAMSAEGPADDPSW